ncbi:MAG: LytTR family DNA-binding domain-containing protein [Bacteroidota bacterium]
MMRVLIVEDEAPAAERLMTLIQAEENIEIVAVLDSVRGTIKWVEEGGEADLWFMDIQLADGHSFSILEQVPITPPIVFTTAYNQYALQAFAHNSLDYLLKPVEQQALNRALEKYQRWEGNATAWDLEMLKAALHPPTYQERFMIKLGEQFRLIHQEEIAYVMAEEGLVFLVTHEGRRWPMDEKLEGMAAKFNPRDFYRINRKFLVRLSAIRKIHTYFNSRLKLDILPAPDMEVIVSRDRVADFKRWLNS